MLWVSLRLAVVLRGLREHPPAVKKQELSEVPFPHTQALFVLHLQDRKKSLFLLNYI